MFFFAFFIQIIGTTDLSSPALVPHLVYPTQKHWVDFLKKEADSQNTCDWQDLKISEV